MEAYALGTIMQEIASCARRDGLEVEAVVELSGGEAPTPAKTKAPELPEAAGHEGQEAHNHAGSDDHLHDGVN